MPFNIGESVNFISDAFLRAPIVSNIAKNTIYTAFLIVLIIMLIILFIFREIEAEESLTILTARSGFWIFMVLSGVLLLHDKVLMIDVNNSAQNNDFSNVFTEKYSGIVGKGESTLTLEDSVVPVTINTDFT